MCTMLFAVPDFPGNLAAFIPGKLGMKKSGNPGRLGNGSLGMNSLDKTYLLMQPQMVEMIQCNKYNTYHRQTIK